MTEVFLSFSFLKWDRLKQIFLPLTNVYRCRHWKLKCADVLESHYCKLDEAFKLHTISALLPATIRAARYNGAASGMKLSRVRLARHRSGKVPLTRLAKSSRPMETGTFAPNRANVSD